MLNIVVPMAGRGQRFVDAGFSLPKPLIAVHGFPMIQVVIQNLAPRCEHRFNFLLLREHSRQFGLDDKLREWAPGCNVVFVDHVTEGAACTVLLAREFIDSPDPLMIANCDQYIDAPIDDYIDRMAGVDGLIMTMWADDPKWSFVGIGPNGMVNEVVEKRVISNEATVGIYNFQAGCDFVRAADEMIAADLRVNNEFYVAPAYNQMIGAGREIAIHNVGRVDAGMYGIGTPTDLDRFLAQDVSHRAVGGLR